MDRKRMTIYLDIYRNNSDRNQFPFLLYWAWCCGLFFLSFLRVEFVVLEKS